MLGWVSRPERPAASGRVGQRAKPELHGSGLRRPLGASTGLNRSWAVPTVARVAPVLQSRPLRARPHAGSEVRFIRCGGPHSTIWRSAPSIRMRRLSSCLRGWSTALCPPQPLSRRSATCTPVCTDATPVDRLLDRVCRGVRQAWSRTTFPRVVVTYSAQRCISARRLSRRSLRA